MKNHQTPISIWQGQLLHLVSVFILLASVRHLWEWLNKPQSTAFWIAVAIPIVHQVYVWLAWRLELRASLTSKLIGFRGYVVIFFILFCARFVSLLVLAWLDQNSLGLTHAPQLLMTTILLVPSIYALYSVRKYFGLARASGADHFDPKYRSMPLVNAGIFRFTNNAMYLYAFLFFWAIAIAFNSASALLVAAYSHLYIWVHYFATEKPDMAFIYGVKSEST